MKRTLVMAFLLATQIIYAQNGALDNSFDGDGKLRLAVPGGLYNAALPRSVILQPDGKILTCGSVFNGSNYDMIVFRFNSDGTPDNSFDGDGRSIIAVNVNDYLFRLALQPDGKIVGAGYTTNAGGNPDFALLRLNGNGSPDNSFDGDGKVITNVNGADDFALALGIQTDGKIVVGGIDASAGGGNSVLLRYTDAGVLDNTFSGDGIASITTFATRDYIYDLKIQPDGKILCMGFDEYQVGPNRYRGVFSRFNDNGTPDNSFDTDGLTTFGPEGSFDDIRLYGLALQSDSKIVAVGFAPNGGSNSFVALRLNINGSLDNGFASAGYRFLGNGLGLALFDVKQEPDGKLVAAGSDNANTSFYIHKFNMDGTNDMNFNGVGFAIHEIEAATSSIESAQGMTLQPGGNILATGVIENSGVFDLAMMRIINDGGFPLPVTWLAFTAKKQQQNVILEWSTATEQNNHGFEVQRSNDGRYYTTIGFITGAGNSTSELHYSFTDINPEKGKNFYRVNQIDIDGKSVFSPTRKVDFTKVFDVLIYPNPLASTMNIQVSEDVKTIKLFDAAGKLVWRRERPNDRFLFSVPVSQLPNGTYVLVAQDIHGNIETQKLMKQ